MAKKAALGAAALIGLAAIVYCAIWWTSAEWLRGELDGWAADMRGRGWTVSYERMRIEGFPASLTAIVDAPSIAAPETSGGWSWQGPQIAAKVRPWNTRRIEFQGAGVHRIRTAGPGREPIRVTAGSAFGLILRLAEARATKIALGLGNVAIDAPGHALPRKFKEADATILVPERPGHADEGRGPEPPGPTIAVSLGEIEFGGTQSDAHGRAIEEASLTAKLIGPPPRDARAGSLAVWRDGGGTVEIGDISIVWQKANGKGSGTVALDRDLQPLAALSIRLEGHADMLRMLVALGWVEKRDAGAIRLGLDLLARASTGQPDKIAVPLTVQNRRLFLGPISVMRLPRIDWDG